MMMTMQIFTKTENKKRKDMSAHIWSGGGHRARAREGHKLVTSFVDHKTANQRKQTSQNESALQDKKYIRED